MDIMLNRKFQVLIFVLAAVILTLSGCGSSAEGVRFALVTGPGGAASDEETRTVAEGIAQYAAEHSYDARSYTAETEGSDAYAMAFKAAADGGARYIVSVGRKMEVPVYEAQGKYKKSRFVLIDGEPRKSPDSESVIRNNTECVTFDRKSIGFIAGFTAVKEGYTKIAWLSGKETDAGREYYEGFLNGAGYAMNEAGISPDTITVYAEFAGSDALSPRRLADARSMYNDGCELIITDREKIAEAVKMAAEELQKPFATVGFDAMQTSANIQFSAIPNPEGAMRALLASFDEAKGFEGGTVIRCTALESGVKLAAEYSRMPVVNEVDVQSCFAAMASGRAAVSNEGTSEGAEAYGHTVRTEAREPVSGGTPVNAGSGEGEPDGTDSFVEVLN